MASNQKQGGLERKKTDKSLRTERDKADRALATRRANVEGNADDVVVQARAGADAELSRERESEDEKLDRRPGQTATHAIVKKGRAIADEVLLRERASMDEALQRERDESSRALRKLLPLERAKTDRHLLTERTCSDEALANRDGFLGIVCHDLRNLLGGIVMSAELLSKGTAEDADDDEILVGTDRIQRYAARMSRLIEDLVDVASVDAGHFAITPTQGDFGAVIAETVETFQPAAARAGLTLESEIVDAPLLGTFDEGRILQVLANLIANSIKFTPEGGRISIHAKNTSDLLEVSVRDTGIGVPTDKLEEVFQRFCQVGANDRRGSGLGLFISRCIIEAHGGTITGSSTKGEGSIFSFTIPTSNE